MSDRSPLSLPAKPLHRIKIPANHNEHHHSMKRLCILLTLLWSSVIPHPSFAAEQRPNVLFIAIDDLRDWTGYLGHYAGAKTPSLDRLAKMGTAFARAYCAAPVCNPSRCALLSGLRPFTTGVYENNADGRTVIPSELSLTTAFRNGSPAPIRCTTGCLRAPCTRER